MNGFDHKKLVESTAINNSYLCPISLLSLKNAISFLCLFVFRSPYFFRSLFVLSSCLFTFSSSHIFGYSSPYLLISSYFHYLESFFLLHFFMSSIPLVFSLTCFLVSSPSRVFVSSFRCLPFSLSTRFVIFALLSSYVVVFSFSTFRLLLLLLLIMLSSYLLVSSSPHYLV